MTILYPNTQKELFYVPDYKPLPEGLESMTKSELTSLYNNVAAAFDNAYIYHAELLESALYNDLLIISGYIEKKR